MAKKDEKNIIKEDIVSTEPIKEEEVIIPQEPVEEISEQEEVPNEVEMLKAQLEEMKQAMAEMMNKSNAPVQNIIVKEGEDDVVIGCRILQGIGLSSNDGEIEISLKFNEEQTATLTEMKKLLRQSGIKKAFEDGICYFKDPTNNKIFNLRCKDLSDEAIIKLVSKKDTNEIIRKLKDLTDDKRNSNILNCIIYRICNMIRKGQLKDWDYYIRKGVESYLEVEFDKGISILNSLDNLRQ